MAKARGMSEAYQKAHPFAAEYALKRAKELAAKPFSEHLKQLKNSGKLIDDATNPIPPEQALKIKKLRTQDRLFDILKNCL